MVLKKRFKGFVWFYSMSPPAIKRAIIIKKKNKNKKRSQLKNRVYIMHIKYKCNGKYMFLGDGEIKATEENTGYV